MNVKFSKYQGTGNDFILIDNREYRLDVHQAGLYERWCNRHFGIGADGLIFIQSSTDADFEMLYFNSDGKPSSFCGNGGRCAVRFAHSLGLGGREKLFLAADGLHRAALEADGTVSLGMKDVNKLDVSVRGQGIFLNTGSPHFVLFQGNPEPIAVDKEGAHWRYHPDFAPAGTNVNFAHSPSEHCISLRTYERGVEAETLSCGTGMVASVLAWQIHRQSALSEWKEWKVLTPGGTAYVGFSLQEEGFRQITLRGPALKVFEGEIQTDQR
jgi:diaminopimelate epimerase